MKVFEKVCFLRTMTMIPRRLLCNKYIFFFRTKIRATTGLRSKYNAQVNYLLFLFKTRICLQRWKVRRKRMGSQRDRKTFSIRLLSFFYPFAILFLSVCYSFFYPFALLFLSICYPFSFRLLTVFYTFAIPSVFYLFAILSRFSVLLITF